MYWLDWGSIFVTAHHNVRDADGGAFAVFLLISLLETPTRGVGAFGVADGVTICIYKRLKIILKIYFLKSSQISVARQELAFKEMSVSRCLV